MLPSFLKRIGVIAGCIVLLILTAIVGLLAWWSGQQYAEQQQYDLISTEGQRVTVQALQVDRAGRSWKDQLGNIVYLTFSYDHKSYTLRYRQDTSWIHAGDRVDLYYHPGIDDFRQPRSYSSFTTTNSNYSRLIRFSIASAWGDGRKWLALCIGLTGAFVLMLATLLATITRLPAIRTAGRAVFLIMVLALAVYLAWNTWQYYRYHSQLKSGAREETVQVISTSSRSTSRRSNWFYTYEATVQHGGQERMIPIAAADYEMLKPGAPLQVYYNSELNDMMSVNHKPSLINLIATLFIWLLLLFFARRLWLKK